MTDKDQTTERDEVLYAFHVECSRPTLEDISKWISKYPQFADDIRAHAAIGRDWDARKEGEFSEEPDQVLLARAYSDALNVLYEAKLQPLEESSSSCKTFQDYLTACGKDVPGLALEMSTEKPIKRSVIAALINGAMRPPIGKRFQAAIVNALSMTTEGFNKALQLALSTPRIGHAKAAVAPKLNARSYQEIIKDSELTPEQIKYWLDEE